MLEALHLTKSFIGPPAVDSVGFTIRPGEILGYLGPNGAGKSTTVKMLTGLLEPSSGRSVCRVGRMFPAISRRSWCSRVLAHLAA